MHLILLYLGIVGIICISVSAFNGHHSHLNVTTNITVCLEQQELLFVLGNFSDPSCSLYEVSANKVTPDDAVIIYLVDEVQLNTTTHFDNRSLRQARNLTYHVLPGSFFQLTFWFFGDVVSKNMTVQFREIMGSANLEQILYSQIVGPSTISQTVNYTVAQEGDIQVEIINSERLTGNYTYNFSIKEIHASSLKHVIHKCTLISSVNSCKNTTLPDRNILLGQLKYNRIDPQCHPIVYHVSLTGQNLYWLWFGITIPIAVFMLIGLLPTGVVYCMRWNVRKKMDKRLYSHVSSYESMQ